MNQLMALILLVLLAIRVQSEPAVFLCFPGAQWAEICSKPVNIPIQVNHVTVTQVTIPDASFQSFAISTIGDNEGTGNCPIEATQDGCVIFMGSSKTLMDSGNNIWSFDNA